MIQPKIELIKAPGGLSIKTAIFEPNNSPVGVVQIIHGFGEHVDRYYEIADFFASNGYVCVIYDQRGHGEMPEISACKRRQKMIGIVKNYDCLLDDVSFIRTEIVTRYPECPVFLYGHSMGGNIVLNYLLKRSENNYDKVILESPWIRLYKPRSVLEVKLAHIIGRLNSYAAINSKLNVHILSRNPAVSEAIKADKYFHTRMSYRLFAQMTYAGEYALLHAKDLKIPILLLCGGKDKIACPKAMREFSEKSKDNVLLFEDLEGYHMLRLDEEETKRSVLNRILEFLGSGQ